MYRPRWPLVVGLSVSVFSGMLIGQTTDIASPDESEPAKVAGPDCPFFGAQRERYVTDALRRSGATRSSVHQLTSMTAAVSKLLGYVPGGSRTYAFDQTHQPGSIDSYIGADFQAHGIKAAPKTTDWEFIRRVTLDLTGRIPAADRVLAFVADTATDKRAKLIDELLADQRFGNALAEQWVIQMIPRESNNRALSQKGLQTWMADHFNKNTPLDKVVYELVTATGEIDKNPAGTYFVANPTVDKITDNVTRMFLGVQLQCAQCHNHPFTDWKQTEYWAMAAFFMKTHVQGTAKGAA